MKIAGAGGSHRDGHVRTRIFRCNTRLALRGHRYDVQALPSTSR